MFDPAAPDSPSIIGVASEAGGAIGRYAEVGGSGINATWVAANINNPPFVDTGNDTRFYGALLCHRGASFPCTSTGALDQTVADYATCTLWANATGATEVDNVACYTEWYEGGAGEKAPSCVATRQDMDGYWRCDVRIPAGKSGEVRRLKIRYAAVNTSAGSTVVDMNTVNAINWDEIRFAQTTVTYDVATADTTAPVVTAFSATTPVSAGGDVTCDLTVTEAGRGVDRVSCAFKNPGQPSIACVSDVGATSCTAKAPNTPGTWTLDRLSASDIADNKTRLFASDVAGIGGTTAVVVNP